MRTPAPTTLLVQAAALVAGPALLLLVVGLPLAAARPLGPAVFVGVVLVAAALSFAFTVAILARWVGRPLDRILDAGHALADKAELPMLGPPGEETRGGLSRAALAFERLAASLGEERRMLSEKVIALERANADVAATRDELARSERLAALGLLAAGIAHEIGNPLGAIAGYAELARARLSGGAAPEVADFVARIAADARRIDGIVRDLLDLARPGPVALGPVALPAALDEALATARVQERFRDVEVTVELPADLPLVTAEPRRLTQVLLNVLLNAGDAMGGRGQVRVTGQRDGERVEVRIADRGPGMAPETLSRVFDPFFTTKAPGKGTGLGLSVCLAAVESFQGSLAAESGTEGATFVLTLRVA